MITQKPKEKSLSVLIKEADLVFGEYIKLRDTKNGVINCFICGKRVKRNEAEVMHFIPRSNMRTRYEEINAHAGDIDCNKFDDNHYLRYHERLLFTYGEDAVINLLALKYSQMKYVRSDLIEMIEDFKLRIKQLKK